VADESSISDRPATPGATPLPNHLAYRHIRHGIAHRLRGQPAAAARPVPACPDWTVLDLLVHLAQNCRAAEANLVPAPPRATRLRGLGLPELLAEWERSAARVESGLRGSRQARAGSVLVMDAFTHEYDIVQALGEAFAPDHPALPAAFDVAFEGFNAAVRRHCLPPLRVRTGQAAWTAGEGRPRACVTGEWIDLYRSLIGRRTTRQIRLLAWSQNPDPWLPTFSWGPFHPPREPIE
jgi:uncharacterized protein (TIGR03083 family)